MYFKSGLFLVISVVFLNSVIDVTAPIVPEQRAANRSLDTQPPPGQRCWGRNQKGKSFKCCTAENPCEEGEGDCSDDINHTDCAGNLKCGNNNCKQFGQYYHKKDDCCEQDPKFRTEPPPGQRCAGSAYNGGTRAGGGKRCCTPTEPCDEGEGDCDGREDGGGGDGDFGCKGDLVCGSNNCRKFGLYYHEKDDCCEKKENIVSTVRPNLPGLPLEPPPGQKCKGRNYEGGRDCCTVTEPCDIGEGDCAARDEGSNNGNRDCKGDLVCGSNNCRKFGLYYHEKDDCCDEPISKQQDKIKCFLFGVCGTTTTEDPLFGNYDYGGQAIGIDL